MDITIISSRRRPVVLEVGSHFNEPREPRIKIQHGDSEVTILLQYNEVVDLRHQIEKWDRKTTNTAHAVEADDE